MGRQGQVGLVSFPSASFDHLPSPLARRWPLAFPRLVSSLPSCPWTFAWLFPSCRTCWWAHWCGGGSSKWSRPCGQTCSTRVALFGSNAPSHEEQTRPTPNAAGYVPKQMLPTRPGGRTDDERDAETPDLASRSKQTVAEGWSVAGRNRRIGSSTITTEQTMQSAPYLQSNCCMTQCHRPSTFEHRTHSLMNVQHVRVATTTMQHPQVSLIHRTTCPSQKHPDPVILTRPTQSLSPRRPWTGTSHWGRTPSCHTPALQDRLGGTCRNDRRCAWCGDAAWWEWRRREMAVKEWMVAQWRHESDVWW